MKAKLQEPCFRNQLDLIECDPKCECGLEWEKCRSGKKSTSFKFYDGNPYHGINCLTMPFARIQEQLATLEASDDTN